VPGATSAIAPTAVPAVGAGTAPLVPEAGPPANDPYGPANDPDAEAARRAAAARGRGSA